MITENLGINFKITCLMMISIQSYSPTLSESND